MKIIGRFFCQCGAVLAGLCITAVMLLLGLLMFGPYAIAIVRGVICSWNVMADLVARIFD